MPGPEISPDLQEVSESPPDVSIVDDIPKEVIREAGGIGNVARGMVKSYRELKPMLEPTQVDTDLVVVRGEAPYKYEIEIAAERLRALYGVEKLLRDNGFTEDRIDQQLTEFVVIAYLTKTAMENGIQQRKDELEQIA